MIVVVQVILVLILSMALTLEANAESDNRVKVFTVGRVSLPYSDVGSGDTIVAVHGAVSDLRDWKGYIAHLSQTHRVVAYTRRFYGTAPWPNGDRKYNASVHASDLAGLIRSLDVGPVHLFARSSGSYPAVIVANKFPELVRSLVQWEPFVGNDLLPSVPGLDSPSMDSAEEWGKGYGPAVKAVKSGDTRTGVERFIEHVYELGAGGFGTLPPETRQMFRDNARTLTLLFSGKTTHKVTCDFLHDIDTPTLVLMGSATANGYAIRHKSTADCFPSIKLKILEGVVHNGLSLRVPEVVAIAHEFRDGLK